MNNPPTLRKVCVVTGSRADYGLLYFLMRQLQDDSSYELQIVATGMHLSPEFGATADIIERDGFAITYRVETLLSSDTLVGVSKATGLGVLGFSEALNNLKPDLVVVLGDRFEIFAAAQAAFFLHIPIAHIGGGDVTAGAIDDAMRHSISKMSHLHFVTNFDAAIRLAKMGENPERIIDVGSPGLDHLLYSKFPDRVTLEAELGFKLRERNFLVTFHPVTLDKVDSLVQLDAMLAAIDRFGEENGVLITLPNADTEGRALIERLRRYGEGKPAVKVFTSLGQRLYLGALAQVDVVIGNSSSGLYEAPSLGTPTVNIGRRQEGRLRAASVFDSPHHEDQIYQAINAALTFGRQTVKNPYQRGDCAKLMMQAIDRVSDFSTLIFKSFYDGADSC